MSIEKEIERAVKRTIALDKDTPYKSAAEQEKIISDIKSALNDATFHFENSKSLMLNQSGKKRLVKQYDNLYSPENILCQSIKQILDRAFKIKFIAYDYFVVIFNYEQDIIGCSIEQGNSTHILLSKGKNCYSDKNIYEFFRKVDNELKLRIPDKFLEAHGWM